MPLQKDEKDKIIKKYKVHDTDTGSSEVQIAILTAEIEQLTGHLKTHKKDFSSRRGLLKKVGQRQRLLRYLQRENQAAFEDIAKKLKLKISAPAA
jgi:small subunit ribosomal protein S15